MALMLIPQGLAYATLAGVPPVYGLYANLLPLIFYAMLGSSSVMSVGPMAITSLLTASALAGLGLTEAMDMVAAAATLAFMSGLFLLVAGLLRLGAIAHLLSHPVVHSFVTGAAILIILGQLKPLLGYHFDGNSAVAVVMGIGSDITAVTPLTALVGVTSLVILLGARYFGYGIFARLGITGSWVKTLLRLFPMLALIVVMGVVYQFQWQTELAVVGPLPNATPHLMMPSVEVSVLQDLWLPALVIGLLGFFESISIAQSFAIKERQPLNPNAELRALGVANIGSSVLQGFPVAGGFSRTMVNVESGAKSPLSGVFSALLIALALWLVSTPFAYLPISALAAMIIASVLPLVHFKPFVQAWYYDRAEFLAMLGTAAGVLLFGVEAGIATGVVLSIMTVVWRTSQPHIAVIGRVPGTEHFRNVDRHRVETKPELLMIRVDENLVFANAEAVMSRALEFVAQQPATRHLVLLMSSVSRIDVTALEMLKHLTAELKQQNILLHLAEIKGPVSDQLTDSDFFQQMTGKIFLSGQQAFEQL